MYNRRTNEIKRIYLWGAGKLLYSVLKSIRQDSCIVLGVIDGDLKKRNTKVDDSIRIIAPDDIEEPYDFILITVKYPVDIEKRCTELNIPSTKIIAFWRDDIGQYNFLDANYKKIALLEEENRLLQLKLDNYPYEHGYVKTPCILPAADLLNEIIEKHRSLCRFGDGEFELAMMNRRPKFQDPDLNLSKRLNEVLRAEDERLCIAIADNFGNLEKYTDGAAYAIREYMVSSRENIMKMINTDRLYYDAYVSRPYMIYRDKANALIIFSLLRKLFFDKKLLVVEGQHTKTGCNNDLFSDAQRIRRIICPDKNSFAKYGEIISTISRLAEEDELILITLGPTATVLAYDLCMAGLWAIDLGQVDNEYEWYLEGAKNMVPIKGKTVSDLNYDFGLAGDLNEIYLNEIVAMVN